MNKLINSLILLFVSVLTFAQESRQQREGRFPSTENSNPESLDNPGDGGQFAPIDDYTFVLFGLAVLLISYIAYRRYQLSKV